MRQFLHHRLSALAALLLSACGPGPTVQIDYAIDSTISLTQLSRVETTIRVAPSDPRQFTADEPFRSIATGIGYEVNDFDGTGTRSLKITHDASLGFVFSPHFDFTLLPPSGSPPPLSITAVAFNGTSVTIGTSGTVDAAFKNGGKVAVLIVGPTMCGATVCSAGQACCIDTCIDIATDAKNCGACNTLCAAGETCSAGLCRCQGGKDCPKGQTCCTSGCADTTLDITNCGTCDNVCATGESCASGTCGCGGAQCPSGDICCAATSSAPAMCNTTCGCTASDGTVSQCGMADPLCCSDGCEANTNDHCGGCTAKCTGGRECADGTCLCAGKTCTDTCCPGGCAVTDTDPSNCGTCDNVCPPGDTCKAGQCLCNGTACAGTTLACCDKQCVDVSGSTSFCGDCKTSCNPEETCTDGKCGCAGTSPLQHCTGSQTCCVGAGCFDVSNDATHCGPTCVACSGGSCSQGKCVQCTKDADCSNGYCCSNKCVARSVTNCTGCGDVCTGTNPCCTAPLFSTTYACNSGLGCL